MDCPIQAEDIKKLKEFVALCSQTPTFLNLPQLDFLKAFIEQFGGKVPTGSPFSFEQPKKRLVFVSQNVRRVFSREQSQSFEY